MGSLLLVPGLDTRLAHLLLERRQVEYPTLHAALTKVRALRQTSPQTLALELVELGLVDAGDVEATIAELLGDALEPTQRWRVGEEVAGLELLASLGSGGMGEVLLARDLETGSEVAVKTLRINEDEDLLARFQREAEAQARVDAHPNVVRIHRSGAASGRAFLVMDAARGGDLGQRLAGGPLEPRAAAELVRDLARGLAYAHARGVLHRDLKPANVLFDERGVPRLADFGLARLLEADGLTRTGEILGTPSYMAPEQASSAPQDERTDVYGLGGILYAALTAAPPFEGATVYALLDQVLTASPPDPRVLAPEVPAGLAAICLRCLAKSPNDRFESALALNAALDAFLAGEDEPASSRLGALGLAAGLALLLALGAAASSLGPGASPTPASPLASSPTPSESRPPPPREVRAQVMAVSAGLERAELAERLLARGLEPRRWLEERAAAPFLNAKIKAVAGVTASHSELIAVWSGAPGDFGSRQSFSLLDGRTGEVKDAYHSYDTLLSASEDGGILVFRARGGSIRLLEVSSRREICRTAPMLEVSGAAFGVNEDLWIVGRTGLRRVLLSAPAEPPQVVWEPPSGEDAAVVQVLPSGGVLVASGRAERCPTRLRLIEAGEVCWVSPRQTLFDGKIRALKVSPDGRWVLLGTASGQIALFSTAAEPRGVRQAVLLYRSPGETSGTSVAALAPRAHKDSVVSLTWLSNDAFLSVDGAPAAFHLWRREGECLARDLGGAFGPSHVGLSRDGRRLYMVSRSRETLTGVLRSSLIPPLD